MDVQRHKTVDHDGDDEAPHDPTKSNISLDHDLAGTDKKLVMEPATDEGVEMTKMKEESAEEKRNEMLKHISLGDLTKTDPE